MRDSRVRELAFLAFFLAVALAASAAERMIPFSFAVPGVRLGLANAVILVALYWFRFPSVLLLTILKCVLTASFAGSFVSFAYSLSGSVLSLLAMSAVKKAFGERISPVGVSVIGAVLHNTGQILAAGYIMGSFLVWAYLPVLMISGVVTGMIVGLLAGCIIPRLKGIYNIIH